MMNNQWIAVSEKLPNQGQKVLATLQCGNKAIVTIIKYTGECTKGCQMTAWMPVPDVYISDIAVLYKAICTYLRKERCNYES